MAYYNHPNAHNRYVVHGVPGAGANSDTSTYSTWGYIKIGDRLTPHPSLQNSWMGTTAPRLLHSSNALAYPLDASGLMEFNPEELYGEVYAAFAMPATEAYIENGECVKTSPLEWATNNGYMGLIIWGTDLHGGGKRVINELSPKGKKISAIPYFFDAQGSPLHLLEIITNILHQGGDTTLTLCQELGTLSNAIQRISHNELVEGEFQDHARFMWGWGMSLENKTSHDDILPGTADSRRTVGQRLSALTISDLRFYMRAGKVEKVGYVNSYRPHVSIGTYAYNISGRFTDQVFGLGSGQSGMELEHAAEFNGNWGSEHNAAFTANQNHGSQNLGFYLAGDGEVDGSPHGDNWQINKEMTSTLNADKTYEIWVKPLSSGRQSLFFGSGTIQHIEIYPNTNNFRTEATRQNGKAFGGSKNQATVLTENYEGRGASSGFEVGQWNCLTITFNTNQTTGNGEVRWYNNGYLIHVGNMWNQTFGVEEYFAFSHIGRATGSSSYLYAKSFHGYFDEFKIYDRVLEFDEITNNVRSSRHFTPKYHTL